MPESEVVRAVIADDEPAAREVVVSLLAEHPEVKVVGEATNGREAIALVRAQQPDLLFLDIQMPDADGFTVLDALNGDVPRGLVFVTAHDEHAIRAFEVHALDYLLKPFGRSRFNAAVSRALERLKALDALSLQSTLASMAQARNIPLAAGELALNLQERNESRSRRPRRIGVRTGTRVVLVDVDSIDWVEASGDYARIHAGKDTHIVSQRMHALERLLEGGSFMRIHRSLIVNLKRVHELHRESDGGGTLVLLDGVRLRVARGRWDALERALELDEY